MGITLNLENAEKIEALLPSNDRGSEAYITLKDFKTFEEYAGVLEEVRKRKGEFKNSLNVIKGSMALIVRREQLKDVLILRGDRLYYYDSISKDGKPIKADTRTYLIFGVWLEIHHGFNFISCKDVRTILDIGVAYKIIRAVSEEEFNNLLTVYTMLDSL